MITGTRNKSFPFAFAMCMQLQAQDRAALLLLASQTHEFRIHQNYPNERCGHLRNPAKKCAHTRSQKAEYPVLFEMPPYTTKALPRLELVRHQTGVRAALP